MNEHTHIEDLTDRIKPRTASNVLLWVVVGFFVVFIVWAALTELDRTVRGQGRVIASSQLQIVSNLEGGVVEAINVKTGQQVAGRPGAGPARPHRDRRRARQRRGLGQRARNEDRPALGRGRRPRAGLSGAGRPGRGEPDDDRALAPRVADAGAGQPDQRRPGAGRPGQPRRPGGPGRLRGAGVGPRRPPPGAEPDPADGRARDRAAAVADAGGKRLCRGGQRGRRRRRRHLARPLGGRRGAVRRSTSSARTGARSPPTSSPPPRPNIPPAGPQLPALAERVERTVVRAPLPGRVNRVLVTTVGAAVGPGRAAGRDRPLRGDPAGRDPGAPAGHRLGADGPEGQGQHHRLRPLRLRLARRRWSPPSRPTRPSTRRPARASTRSRCGRPRTPSSATAGSCRSAPAWSPTSACSATSAPSSTTSSARSPSSARPPSASKSGRSGCEVLFLCDFSPLIRVNSTRRGALSVQSIQIGGTVRTACRAAHYALGGFVKWL